MRASNYSAKGYRQQSVTAAAAITSIPDGARYVLIAPEAAIRLRDDATNPTASVGFPVAANGSFWYDGADLSALKVISVSGTAVVNFLFFG